MSTQLLTIVALGIACNLDNACIGIGYGLASKRIRPAHNLLVSLISGAFALVSCLAAQLISQAYVQLATVVGAILLILLGGWTMTSALRNRGMCTDEPIRDANLKEMCVLGVSMALNCLAASFGVGLSGIGAGWVALSVAGFSYLAVWTGNHMGVKAAGLFGGPWLNVVSGLILVLMGVWQMMV